MNASGVLVAKFSNSSQGVDEIPETAYTGFVLQSTGAKGSVVRRQVGAKNTNMGRGVSSPSGELTDQHSPRTR